MTRTTPEAAHEAGAPTEYRPARPGDERALAELDGSFVTDTVWRVRAEGDGFALRETRVDPPLRKVFPEEDEAAAGDWAGPTHTVVAVRGGALCGFVRYGYEEWNRRLTVHDIEVAAADRGRGVGRALMEHALAFGRERGAGHAWLEVSSVNVPAVRAYRRMGFVLCGLDTSLYEGTGSAGETALFMSRPLG